MERQFEGFDPLPLNENGFELFKDGQIYLSLYHHCRLNHFAFESGKGLVLELTKVYDSKCGPRLGSKNFLTFVDAEILQIDCQDEGNFEDVNELTLMKVAKDRVKVDLMISAMTFTISCRKIVLRADIDNPDNPSMLAKTGLRHAVSNFLARFKHTK